MRGRAASRDAAGAAVVKSRNAREEMALWEARNHYARENICIRRNAPRPILAILQNSPKIGEVWRSLEKFGEVWSLLNWQTTQAWLASSKLPQSRTYLIQMAATPAISFCSVTAAHWEARPLVLAILVRNGRSRVTSQEQGDQWNSKSAHHAGSWRPTYRHGVAKGSHNLVTPALSIGKLMGSFSSSKVLKKTRW